MIVMAFGMCVSGLFFSFFKGWYFSLILLIYFPVMLIAAIGVGMSFSVGFSENMKAYGQSAGYAEQALNAIKVVFAFGQEEKEAQNYEKYLNRARKVGVKTHFWGGLATGFFFFSLYGYFTWALFSGSYMITWKEMNDNTGKLYSSGDILACFLGIVYGVFSLGLAAPNVQSLTEGRVAGKMAFDIIDRHPAIPLNDPAAIKVDPKKLVGKIEFRNVTFTYPTRPG